MVPTFGAQLPAKFVRTGRHPLAFPRIGISNVISDFIQTIPHARTVCGVIVARTAIPRARAISRARARAVASVLGFCGRADDQKAGTYGHH